VIALGNNGENRDETSHEPENTDSWHVWSWCRLAAVSRLEGNQLPVVID
jgi:hypothetical protein